MNCIIDNLFKVHLRTEDREQSCPFEECPYKSPHTQKMKIHLAQVHQEQGRRYCCHLCVKRFLRGHYLTKHLARSHLFRQPPGHSRFRYKLDDDGMFRVETIRFESGELIIDVDDVVGDEREMEEEEVDDVAAAEHLENDEQRQDEDNSTMLVD